MTTRKLPRTSIPESWPSHVKSGILHIISLAHFSITHARGWAANSVSERVRTIAEDDRLHQEIALLREELRLVSKLTSSAASSRRGLLLFDTGKASQRTRNRIHKNRWTTTPDPPVNARNPAIPQQTHVACLHCSKARARRSR